MKRWPIIITVPHAVCERDSDTINHSCDLVALDTAQYLQKALGKKRALLIVGHINRRISDLNRKSSRFTDFRQDIRDCFHDNLIVLDVHSFPPKTTRKYDGAHVAIGTNSYSFEHYVRNLTDYILLNGIYTFAVNNLTTDIITEAKDNDVAEAYLLEFNEKIKKSYRYHICDVIADYFFDVV